MTNSISRQQFEEWFCKKYELEPSSQLLGRSKEGDYLYRDTSESFESWEASREAVVVELPSTEGFGDYSEETARLMRDGCADAIEAAGLKVNP